MPMEIGIILLVIGGMVLGYVSRIEGADQRKRREQNWKDLDIK